MLSRAALIFAFLLSSNVANAAYTVLANAPDPYPQYVMGDADISIYYAGNKAGSPSVSNSLNSNKNYRFIDTDNTGSAGLIYLDVSTSKPMTVASNQAIAVVIKAVGGNVIELTGASTASGSDAPTLCTSGGNCLSLNKGAFYSAGTTLRLSFSVTQLCAAAGTGLLCTGSVVQDTLGTTLNQNISVNFGVVSTATVPTSSDVMSATTNDQSTITFGITDINPTLTCPSGAISNYYFPGDGQIYLYPSNFAASVNGGVPIQYLIALGLESTGTANDALNGGFLSNSIQKYISSLASTTEITGFTNTTNGSDHQYAMVVQSQNTAGLISSSKCNFNGVQSQNISGILTESKCFIATAAYHDGRAAPVMMLRKFRDQVLSQFSLGRDFIKTYYQYSPAMAEWAWDKPMIRSLALKALAPIELIAWAILKFSSAEESYIEKVKKSLPSDQENQDTQLNYSEKQKKKLEETEQLSPEADQSYIERLKKKLAVEEKVNSENYSEKEKAKLPAIQERESPITKVKEGRDEKLDLGELGDIKNAAGFKVGISPGMQVTVANGVHSFSDIYGTGFQPELIFHFERQLFHSENFGSFGLGTDFGLAYSGGKGLLQFGFNSTSQSATGFSFIQVPALINATYRFNLLRLIRPYATVGSGAIFYTETREDSKGDKRGYSAVYHGSVGTSILMDFLDAGTRRDSYLSNGIQHTYLFIEYLYLKTFKSNVMFSRAGIYSGFLFEF